MQVIAVIGFLIFIKNREIFIFSICFCIGFTILAVGELPSHGHSANTNTAGNHTHTYKRINIGGGNVTSGGVSSSNWLIPEIDSTTSSSGNHSHTVSIGNTGSNTAHNNMQPYLSIYMWKRIN